MKFYYALLLLLFFNMAQGQLTSYRRCISSATPLVELGDSNWIYSPSLKIRNYHKGFLYPDSSYRLNKQTLSIDTTIIKDSITIDFLIFPYKVNTSYFAYDSSDHHEAMPPEYSLLNKQNSSANKDWWESPNIEYAGNYNRGLSLGNNQSLIVNSALNLQIQGDLGDGLKITGAITDNQIPIQAEGNTRQIQEFDRLYIELKKNNTSFTVGDFDLIKPYGYYQNYFKKSLGALFQSENKWKKFNVLQKAAIGISKGKFNRLTIPIVNGNQGPYRLKGRDGENFIIILSASEKVFLDGQILERGNDADYVIDYNLGEIRFTPKRLVTDQMRLIVEFEYTDQNYLRSLLTYNVKVRKNDWTAYLNYFRENDSKKPSVSNDLDSTEKTILINSGDNPTNAISSKIIRAGTSYKPDRIYYSQKDTTVNINGTPTSKKYFTYEEKSDSNSLQIIFTEVGQGKGEYQLVQSNANGRIYKWIGVDPITSQALGSYAPYKILVAPRNQQMLSVGLEYIPKNPEEASIRVETSLSKLDLNRLSTLNDNDNIGFAGNLLIKAPKLKSKNFNWDNLGSFEYNDKNFNALNPFRNPEFNRDWNIESQTGFNDRILNLVSNLNFKKILSAQFQFNQFNRNFDYSANKYIGTISFKDSLNEFKIILNSLNTNWQSQKTNYQRPGIYFSRNIFRNISVGASWDQEKNARSNPMNDTLLASSYFFNVYNSFISFSNQKNNNFKLDWKRRIDEKSTQKNFLPFSISDEFTIGSQFYTKKSGIWEANFTARNLQFNDQKLKDSLAQNYFLGQLDHSIQIRRNAIRLKTIYSLQSGAEPRTEYIFEERRPGEGNYIYMDFNHDGIRQIQEYILAPLGVDTARYVRIQLFNSEYIQAYQSSINSFVSIDLGKLMKPASSNTFWRKWSYESVLRFNNKVKTSSNILDRINPILLNKNNSQLLTFQKTIQQQLYFNRANPKYEISTSYINNANQLLLISGFESRDKIDWTTKARWTFRNDLDWILLFSQITDSRSTEFYILQNYKVNSNIYDLSATYRFNRDIRIQMGSKVKNSNEQKNNLESAKILEFYTLSQWAFKRKASIRLDLKYISIQYAGQAGTAIEYIMLEGLKNGKNLTSDLSLDYRISNVISSQISYLFFKPSESKAIQTARLSIRANF